MKAEKHDNPDENSSLEPIRIGIESLIDPERIFSAARLLSSYPETAVSILAFDSSGPTPITPNAEVVFPYDSTRIRLLDHWNIAMKAMEKGLPVDVIGDKRIHSSPVMLRWEDAAYPKLAITIELPTLGLDLCIIQGMLDNLTQSFSEEISAVFSSKMLVYKSISMQARLQEDIQKLGLFLKHVGGALAVIDKDCRVVWTNDESRRNFHLVSDGIGLHCSEVVKNTPDTCLACTVRKSFSSGNIETRIVNRETFYGEKRSFRAVATPIFDSDNRVVQVVLLAYDITDLVRVEQELLERTEMLEIQHRKVLETTQQKNRFFTNVSHDLRTPLTSVIGFTDILLDDEDEQLSPRQAHILLRVKQNAERLLAMINDILDLSKLESGRTSVHLSPVCLPALINEVIDTMTPLIRGKDVVINVLASENLPTVRTDEQKLSQILTNLVSNAVKFTPRGSIKVTAVQRNDSIRISVRDTGIGIKKCDLHRIFEEFAQAGDSAVSKNGTGLGLAITRKLVTLLGANIQVKSKLGVGSEFIVTLPISLVPASISPSKIEAG